jgi:hypothetical protein
VPPPRRFLLSRPPDAGGGPEVVVRQVFWRLGDGFVLRLRREGPAGVPSRDTLTVHGPGAEWVLPLDRGSGPGPAGNSPGSGAGGPGRGGPDAAGRVDPVAALFRAGAGHRVVALRRRYRLDGRDWDVDDYQWENAGLLLARPLTDAPRPSWAVRDVTGEPAYDEENLAYAPFTTWPARSR